MKWPCCRRRSASSSTSSSNASQRCRCSSPCLIKSQSRPAAPTTSYVTHVPHDGLRVTHASALLGLGAQRAAHVIDLCTPHDCQSYLEPKVDTLARHDECKNVAAADSTEIPSLVQTALPADCWVLQTSEGSQGIPLQSIHPSACDRNERPRSKFHLSTLKSRRRTLRWSTFRTWRGNHHGGPSL